MHILNQRTIRKPHCKRLSKPADSSIGVTIEPKLTVGLPILLGESEMSLDENLTYFLTETFALAFLARF